MFERTLVVGPFQCNCRLLACPKTGEAVLLDPGDEPERILKMLNGEKLPSGARIRVKHLLHTHGHLDHIAATRKVREALAAPPASAPPASAPPASAPLTSAPLTSAPPAPTPPDPASAPTIWLHRDDVPLYQQLKMQGSLFGLKYDDPLPVDHHLEDTQELRVGELKLTVLHTPGHSPGSVCLRLHEDSSAQAPESLYSGDTLFAGSVGRTDLWGADADLMFKNIRTRLLTLDGDTRVCPGHGPDSSIGVEKRENPFLI